MVVTARGYSAIHDRSLPDESRIYCGALGRHIGPVVPEHVNDFETQGVESLTSWG
jgi:hypothetical protein